MRMAPWVLHGLILSLLECRETAKSSLANRRRENTATWSTQKAGEKARLSADGGAQSVGEGLAEALDIGFVFGFDHDASELLGAGVAKDHAAVVAERGLGFGQGAGDFRKRLERRFRAHLHVDNQLWIVLEAFYKRLHFTLHGDQRGNFCSREQAVAGWAVVEKNDVAGLLTTENVSAAEHFLENVAIANGGTGQRNIFARKRALEAQVRHRGSDDAVTFELVLRFEVARRR